MPNSWDHFKASEDATCIAPITAPYGRWNVDEIVYASVPSVVLITLWRIIFCYILGDYLGGYVARRDTPNPHPKPSFIDRETNKQRLKSLHKYFLSIENKKSKVPKLSKKKEEKSKDKYNQKTDAQLSANIKKRIENTESTGNTPSKPKNKRRKLVLPAGLDQNHESHSPENLAFLASLDSDTTRKEIPNIMKELDYTLDEIREYCQYQKDYYKMKQLKDKFNEEAWKGVTMLFVTIYGIYVMNNESFWSNPKALFKEWPQIESWRVFLYYQIATGYHAHRAVWQFWDKKRKDIIAMFIHHWVTVVLVASSWYWGIMNIGAVVMVVHDNADIFLPGAKCGRWLKWNLMKNVSFVLFVSSWIISRIGLFSWKVIIPVFMYAPTAYSCHYDKFVFFASLLLVLLCLHFYWAYMILKVAIDWLCCGQTVEDTRSDSEEDKEEIIIKPEEFSTDDEDGKDVTDKNEIMIETNVDNNTAGYKIE